MSLFSFNQKDGPGISKDSPEKNRFFNFFDIYFRNIWKLVTLNLIYIAFCIPVLTIGPATTGFSYVLRKIANDQHVDIMSDFWASFKSNFKQSFFAGIIELALSALFIFNFWFYSSEINMNNPDSAAVATVFNFGLPLLYIAVGFCIFMRFYLYTILATFNVTFRQLYKNSFLFAVIGVLRNIALLALTLFFVFLPFIVGSGLFIPIYAALFLLIIPSTLGLIIVYCTYPLLKKHMIDPYLKEQEEKKKELIEKGELVPELKEEEEPIFKDTVIKNNV